MLISAIVVLMTIGLCINGWRRGLMRSWRGIIAMFIATLVTQHLYLDLANWISSKLILSSVTAIISSYLTVWLVTEGVLQMALAQLIKANPKSKLGFLDKVGGIGYGLVKAMIIALFPLMVASMPVRITQGAKETVKVTVPNYTNETIVTTYLEKWAHQLLPVLGKYVVKS